MQLQGRTSDKAVRPRRWRDDRIERRVLRLPLDLGPSTAAVCLALGKLVWP